MIEKYVFCLIYDVLYIMILISFMDIFFVRRKNEFKYLLLYGSCLCIINYAISILLNDYIAIKQIAVIVVNMSFVKIIYNKKLKHSFLMTAVYQGILMLVEFGSLVLLYKFFNCDFYTSTEKEAAIVNYLLSYFCLFLYYILILILKKIFSDKKKMPMNEIDWVRFSVFPLVSIFIIVLLLINYTDFLDRNLGNILIVIDSGLLFMNIMVFDLLNAILEREVQLTEKRLVLERGRNNVEFYKTAIDNLSNQRKQTHEFKNHISCISSLISKHEYDELALYVNELQEHINVEGPITIDTNNKLINAILNDKYQEAKSKSICMLIKANDLSNIKISDLDLVIILSNLLNNAIEACEICSNKLIKIKFVIEEYQTILAVENTYSNKPVNKNGKFVTLKKDNSEDHGIGIENIKTIVEKNKGEYCINVEEDVFQFVIILPN